MGGGGGGQKFLLNRLQAVGTHGTDNTASGPMVMQPMLDVQASVRNPDLLTFSAAAGGGAKVRDWGSNRRPHGCQSAALPLGHFQIAAKGLPAAWARICH